MQHPDGTPDGPDDLTAYPRPSVAVDVVVLTIDDGAWHAVLARRTQEPAKGRLALPGGFVRIDEAPEDAVARVLREKTGLSAVAAEQLYTFGAVDRDSRGRVISIAYFALVPPAALRAATLGMNARLARLDGGAPAKEDDVAFDHPKIIATATSRIAGKAWYTPVARGLLPDPFTLRELAAVYRVILGRDLNYEGFRGRITRSGLITATGGSRTDGPHRPAALYRFLTDAEIAGRQWEGQRHA